MFLKDLFCRQVKTRACLVVWERVKPPFHRTWLIFFPELFEGAGQQQDKPQPCDTDITVPRLYLWQYNRKTGLIGALYQWIQCWSYQPGIDDLDWILSGTLSWKSGKLTRLLLHIEDFLAQLSTNCSEWAIFIMLCLSSIINFLPCVRSRGHIFSRILMKLC